MSRGLVGVPETKDIGPFLKGIAEEFGGIVKVKNRYNYPPKELEEEFNLRLVLVSVEHDDGRTIGDLLKDQAWGWFSDEYLIGLRSSAHCAEFTSLFNFVEKRCFFECRCSCLGDEEVLASGRACA